MMLHRLCFVLLFSVLSVKDCFTAATTASTNATKKSLPQCPVLTVDYETLMKRGIAEQARLKAAEERKQERLRKEKERKQRQAEKEENRRKQEEARKKREQQKQQQKNPNKQEKKAECPYTILGVARDATKAEIKKAFRQLSLEHHPDKNRNNDTATEVFAKLVDAYEILGDEDRRAIHDDESFGAYQSRPHNFDSKAGFYGGTSMIKSLNETEFDRLVNCKGPLEEEEECVPWMIKFYAPWCVHCKNMIPDWKRTAFTMDGTETPLGFVRFGAVNCETDKKLCNQQAVRSFPSIQLYAHDATGQEHVEKFPRKKSRNVENLIEHAEKGIRLAHESSLQAIDGFIFEKHVTNPNTTGLWIVLFESDNCPRCGLLKAQLRRMSANMGNLASFGIIHCKKDAKICQQQYVGKNGYPELRLYPYQGSKGTGETLVKANEDPLVVLPVAEKVIRMCIANIEAENALMKTLHEDAEEEEEEPPIPEPEYEYPEPETVTRVAGGQGVKAVGGSRTQFKISS